jgi:hypothetical protein
MREAEKRTALPLRSGSIPRQRCLLACGDAVWDTEGEGGSSLLGWQAAITAAFLHIDGHGCTTISKTRVGTIIVADLPRRQSGFSRLHNEYRQNQTTYYCDKLRVGWVGEGE